MKPRLVATLSDVMCGVFFPGHAEQRSRLVKTLNAILKHDEQISQEFVVSSLSVDEVRRDGLKALIRPLSGLQGQVQRLQTTLRKKEERIAELEEQVANMKDELSELRHHVKRQDAQLQECQCSMQSQARQRQEREQMLNGVVDALEHDSWQGLAPEAVSEDLQDLAQTIQSLLSAWHERSAQQRQQHAAATHSLVAALQQIARGEIPEGSSDDMAWIKSAAVTLQEVYSGNASVATTIQDSMGLLFTIADELSEGAALQMMALQNFQKTVAQISQNTVKMANQTDDTAKVAQEIYRLTESLMAEAEEMISAVGESHKNIEDIHELMEQSSLLALNARIIAAQAGEQGRGFAVVAEAIKDLSTRTDTFVQLITERVQAIIKRTTTVHEGVQRIAKSMGAVQQHTDQVASGTHEYSISTQQLTRSVEHLLSRTQHSELLAKHLSSMAKRISIALEQLTDITLFFEQSQGLESEIYRTGDIGEQAAPIPGITTVDELRKQHCAAVFINKGPVDQIQEYQMQQEADWQGVQLQIYSGENSARRSFQIAEKLISDNTIDILFWQTTNNLTFHRLLYLAKQHHVLVIPFCRGANVSKGPVPFQTLTQHYEEGQVAAEYVPTHSRVYAILGPEHVSVANVRAQGFLWNLSDGSRCVEKDHGDWTEKEAALLMKNFLDKHPQDSFDVIYGINDTSALGAIRACLEYSLLEFMQRNALRWTPKRVIGTDVSEDMLRCMHGIQGKMVVGRLLEKIVAAADLEQHQVTLSEHAEGWAVQWHNEHEAIFRIHDGQISVRTKTASNIIIQDMVTVSHSTFCDESGTPIGVGATAIKHLIECIQAPGQPPYLCFSQEQGITKDTPDTIWKPRQYVLTDTHTQWRSKHVMTLSSHQAFIPIGEL